MTCKCMNDIIIEKINIKNIINKNNINNLSISNNKLIIKYKNSYELNQYNIIKYDDFYFYILKHPCINFYNKYINKMNETIELCYLA